MQNNNFSTNDNEINTLLMLVFPLKETNESLVISFRLQFESFCNAFY